MPLQNRVTPLGDLIAVPERGQMFGNRGNLHDGARRIVRYSQGRRWLVCRLEFRGRHRVIMTPGAYTELFFLDEATALAAGHRPCAECRNADYQDFRHRWLATHPQLSGKLPSADEIDAEMHQDRLLAPGVRNTYLEGIGPLPDGVFILCDQEPWLLWRGELRRWTPGGYDEHRRRPTEGQVTVLTPRSTVGIIAAGYVPSVHSSAEDLWYSGK
jgi:hypothetical protein